MKSIAHTIAHKIIYGQVTQSFDTCMLDFADQIIPPYRLVMIQGDLSQNVFFSSGCLEH
jgi:hypothetical protein